MKRFIPTFVFVLIIAGLIRWPLAADPVMAAAPTRNAAEFTAGPELELATDTSAIIRWIITNPGGTDLHYGLVHYGTDAVSLAQIAKSPNRRNPSHPDMIFRVRITGLDSHTTYYYTVESTGARGASDGPPSPVGTFTTR